MTLGLGREALATLLLPYVRARRWFRSKARPVRGARIADLVPLDGENTLAVLEIDYQQGDPELYAVALARGEGPIGHGLVDGLVSGQAAAALLALLHEGRTVRGESGSVEGQTSVLLERVAGAGPLPVVVPDAEQTNSALRFGDRMLVKVYRRLVAGPNPELEIGRFLTATCDPPCAPRVLGDLIYRDRRGVGHPLAIAHELVAHDGDAWTLALGDLRAVLAGGVGGFAARATTLGRRTAELHLALARGRDPDFAPEPFSAEDRAALAARATAMLDEHLAALERLPPAALRGAEPLLAADGRRAVGRLLDRLRETPVEVVKTRTHGDLHLGQVLVRGDDFLIIDFEGEPARPLEERRAKGSPLRDVMGMVRSFDYAAAAVVRERPGDEARAHRWRDEATAAYRAGYLAAAGAAPFLPRRREELGVLCTFFELEKVIYEIGYEANNRPDWVDIPLRGLLRIAGLG